MAKNKGKQFEQKFKEDFLKIKDATKIIEYRTFAEKYCI